MWSSIKSAFNSVTGQQEHQQQQQQGTNADGAEQHVDPTSNETATTSTTRKTGILPLGLASLYSHRSSNADENDKENTKDQIVSLAFDAESNNLNDFDNSAFVKKFTLETVAKIKDAHQEERIWNVEWHPNGEMFATCGGDKTIRVWRRRRFVNANVDKDKIDDDDAVAGDAKQNSDVVSFFQACEAVEHRRTVRRVAWSPCGKFLAAASFDNVVSIWRLFECAPTTTSSTSTVDTSSKNEIQYSLLSLELESMLEGHENEVKACVFDPLEGRILATCSRDRSVWVWEKLDPNNNNNHQQQEQEDPDALVEFETLAVLGGHSQDVKSVTFAPTLLRHSSHFNTADASFEPVNPRQLDIVSSSYDDTIKIWRNISRTAEDDWHCVQTIAKHQGTVWESRFQPQGIYSPSSLFSETNNNNNFAADFEKLSCVSDNNSFPAFASCGHDGRVFLFRLALPSAADMKNSKLTKQQQTNIGRISKYECVGSLGDFHEGGAAIVALDWLPPVPAATSSPSSLALNFLSRSSLILSCGTDDKICLLDCPMLRRKPALIFNCDFLAEEKNAANNNFEESGNNANSNNSDLICVEKFASPHTLEMNCVRVASRWESLEFGEEEIHNNGDDDDKSMTKRKILKKAAVLVVTVADDGDICVSRLKLEF